MTDKPTRQSPDCKMRFNYVILRKRIKIVKKNMVNIDIFEVIELVSLKPFRKFGKCVVNTKTI